MKSEQSDKTHPAQKCVRPTQSHGASKGENQTLSIKCLRMLLGDDPPETKGKVSPMSDSSRPQGSSKVSRI